MVAVLTMVGVGIISSWVVRFKGNRVFGQFPTVALNGPEDAGQGRLIPTTSVDEYAGTLARWFGVSQSNLPLVLPNIGRFASRDLGFMGALA